MVDEFFLSIDFMSNLLFTCIMAVPLRLFFLFVCLIFGGFYMFVQGTGLQFILQKLLVVVHTSVSC